MTALAGPMSGWGEKECSSVMKQALEAQNWTDGGPQMPPIKVRPETKRGHAQVCRMVFMSDEFFRGTASLLQRVLFLPR